MTTSNSTSVKARSGDSWLRRQDTDPISRMMFVHLDGLTAFEQ